MRTAFFVANRASAALLAVLALPLALGACGPAKPAVAAAPSPPAEVAPAAQLDTDTLRARESNAELKAFPVKDAAGKVLFSVLATEEPKVEETPGENGAPSAVSSHFDMKTPTPVECTMLKNRVDPANFARQLLKVPEDAQAAIETRALSVNHRNVVLFSTFFVWGPEGHRTASGPKIAIAATDGGSLVCVHDELGYAKTFERVVRSVVASFAPPGSDPAPRLHEIMQIAGNDAPVGTAERMVYDRKDGGRGVVEFTALLSFGEGKLHAEDGATARVFDKAGSLVTDTVIRNQDGEVRTKLTAKRLSAHEYAVEGKLDGADVKTKVKTPQPVLDDITRAPLLKAISSGKKASPTYAELDISVTPAVVKTWAMAKGDGKKVMLSNGPDVRSCEVDDAGLCAAELGIGGSMQGFGIKRVDRTGAP